MMMVQNHQKHHSEKCGRRIRSPKLGSSKQEAPVEILPYFPAGECSGGEDKMLTFEPQTRSKKTGPTSSHAYERQI